LEGITKSAIQMKENDAGVIPKTDGLLGEIKKENK
jgi:hypothetical protein